MNKEEALAIIQAAVVAAALDAQRAIEACAEHVAIIAAIQPKNQT
jgi:hypothetical protein